MEEYTEKGKSGRFCGEMDVSRRDLVGGGAHEESSGGGWTDNVNRFRHFVMDSPAAVRRCKLTSA